MCDRDYRDEYIRVLFDRDFGDAGLTDAEAKQVWNAIAEADADLYDEITSTESAIDDAVDIADALNAPGEPPNTADLRADAWRHCRTAIGVWRGVLATVDNPVAINTVRRRIQTYRRYQRDYAVPVLDPATPA